VETIDTFKRSNFKRVFFSVLRKSTFRSGQWEEGTWDWVCLVFLKHGRDKNVTMASRKVFREGEVCRLRKQDESD
jgi:hypothetical protein